MSIRISSDDLHIHAERTIRQYQYADLDSMLAAGQDPEDFFEYQDEWEDDEQEEFEYHIEVSGVVSQSLHNKVREDMLGRIEDLEKQIKDLSKMENPEKKEEGEE